ncbi:ATP-binding cassette, subfamily F, member 3 [Treponema berlinense]|uniref:ATP-binding cassette, subfamily F, member 3 n=1 Tax=Treponema berlinense TaxID=225004 RepID=A0A1T4QJR8_9SPIR|nr:ABC-F family ATP-binding cassette domain-containing protein [Treponema berlinense]MDY3708356.1 ABC-F family ATP-binding cassette domain-containing protein [Treponema berlinense]SKA03955.1 ATP-binding cassette, subfamily F, member 3 [Treponema berlinense]
MAFVQFSQVSLAFGDRDILKNVSVNLQAGSKVALTGANGSGKSTLIKVMAGLVQPDGGQRVAQKDARIAYLPQSGLTHHGCSLREEADKAFGFGYELQAEMEKIGDKLKNGEGNEKLLLERHDAILTELEESGWNRRQVMAEQVLAGLGFSREDLDKNCEEFSGGWQMRIALGKALMVNPDILLLDEPTNYLDIEARGWLEKFLDNYKGGFLLVSHDRYFLDHTVNEVYELFNGELKRYPGNYTHYEKVREIELETLIREYEKQQAEIAHLQEFINRFGVQATKAAQAQERQKMLDKILEKQIVIPESLKKIHFKFPPAPHSGRLVATLSKITKSYDGEHNVLQNLDLVLENGERLVVAGHNGAGKSTLLRIIAGADSDFSGEVKLGSGVKIGYFSQDNAETLKGSASVLETVESEAPLELIPKIRDMLGAFLFRGDDVHKSLDVLSGGEKARVALLKLLLRPVNFLILDEPTNHLDMHSKDVLLDALKDFGGTVIFVSHDRGFIENLSTRVLELKPGQFRLFPGDYKYYMERLEREANGEFSQNDELKSAAQPEKNSQKEEKTETKRSWEEQKKLESERRRAEKNVKNLEEQILKLEEEKSSQEAQMAKPEVYSNGEKAKAVQKKIDELAEKLEELNLQWMEAAEALEKF